MQVMQQTTHSQITVAIVLEGLKISTFGIVFKDKSELVQQIADWEYLENNK